VDQVQDMVTRLELELDSVELELDRGEILVIVGFLHPLYASDFLFLD